MKKSFSYSSAGIYGLVTTSWLTNLLSKVYRGEFRPEEDLWECPNEDKSYVNGEKLEQLWRDEVRRKTPKRASFLSILIRHGIRQFIIILVGYIGMAIGIFLSTSVCVHYLLQYSSSGTRDLSIGLALVAALVIMMFLRVLCLGVAMNFGAFLCVTLRAATVSLLYRKVLKIRDINPETVGMLVNVLASDGQRIQRGIRFSLAIVCGPPVFVAAFTYSLVILGPLSLLGFFVFALQILFLFNTARLMGGYNRTAASVTDKRIKLISEILSSIKTIKIQAWERSFAESVLEIRRKETAILFKVRLLRSLIGFASGYATAFSQILSVAALILVKTSVSSVEVFSMIAVLNTLKIAVDLIPTALSGLVDMRVACQRIKLVLLLAEYTPPDRITNPADIDKLCVKFERATFAHAGHMDRDEAPPGVKTVRVDPEAAKDKEDKQEVEDSNYNIKLNNTKSYGSILEPSQDLNGNGTLNKGEYNSYTSSVQETLPGLSGLNFGIEKGRLIGICGAIGTGKSSLLLAILGRMKLVSGSFQTDGRMAYVPQKAWVLNATLKENIIFGYPYDEKRYRSVIADCCLMDDINLLPDGEDTEIGERGVNLSGGQKQRVSMARAVYSDRDVYLLDDPLSAVDNRVATALFENCIRGALKNKSVLLVTHQVRFLSDCDKIIFLMTSGIVANVTHEELIRSNSEYHQMIRAVAGKEQKKNGKPNGSNGQKNSREIKKIIKKMDTGRKFSGTEEVTVGDIGLKTLRAYVKAAGGWFTIFVTLFMAVMFVCSQSFPAWWLTHWFHISSNETISTEQHHFTAYMAVFGSSGLFLLFFGIASSCFWSTMTFKASTTFHTRILRRVMRGQMAFFDVTPIGRIQNLFSSDLSQLDSVLTYYGEYTVVLVSVILVVLCSVTVSSPLVAVLIVPIFLLFGYIWSRSMPAVRVFKRLENVARSPIYSLITATVEGQNAIIAYGKDMEFTQKFCELLDKHQVPLLLSMFVSRWCSVRLDSSSVCFIFLTALLIVVSPDRQTSAQAGLALTFALQLTGILTMATITTNQVLASSTSVERINSYIENFPLELRYIKPYFSPESTWPEKGEILFHKFSLRYHPHLPNVLNEISIHIQPGEKVGVVGRTGAGKSSLMVALYRLAEGRSGGVFIDGIDITTLPVRQLRAKLSLIPQDPVLFGGSVRFNIDPFDEKDDESIWEAIDKCNMKEKIADLPGQLDAQVLEGGMNFSGGERQLICMSRALLHQSKVMLLDEATASVDPQTDALIQTTIRTAFTDCTMLIIAHRLNTVLDCDKILVMEQGRVAEFDSPENLSNNPQSHFRKLLDATALDE